MMKEAIIEKQQKEIDNYGRTYNFIDPSKQHQLLVQNKTLSDYYRSLYEKERQRAQDSENQTLEMI